MIGRRLARLRDYLVTGSRSRAALRRGIQRRWQGFYRSDADITSGPMPWETTLFDRFIPSGSDVLLVGSGSGRDLIALAERGCRVTGVEPADEAARTANRMLAGRALTANVIEGFFEDASVTGVFDAVMFSFHAYAYVPESARRIAALRKAASLTRSGGHVIVSHPAHMKRPSAIFILLGRMAGALARSDWRIEAGDLVSAGVEHPGAINFVHAFEDGEVEREARAAGLDVAFRAEFADDEVVAVALRSR